MTVYKVTESWCSSVPMHSLKWEFSRSRSRLSRHIVKSSMVCLLNQIDKIKCVGIRTWEDTRPAFAEPDNHRGGPLQVRDRPHSANQIPFCFSAVKTCALWAVTIITVSFLSGGGEEYKKGAKWNREWLGSLQDCLPSTRAGTPKELKVI